MMACTLCKLVSGDNKIPLNTYADFKKRQRKGEREGWKEEKAGGRRKRFKILKNKIKVSIPNWRLYHWVDLCEFYIHEIYFIVHFFWYRNYRLCVCACVCPCVFVCDFFSNSWIKHGVKWNRRHSGLMFGSSHRMLKARAPWKNILTWLVGMKLLLHPSTQKMCPSL